MKKIFSCLLTFLALNVIAMPLDSIGVKTLNGKQYVMHKVTKGEGVFGISKKYGVTAEDIYASNEGASKGIKIDQVLLIPRKGVTTASGTKPANTSSTKTEKKYHTVSSGQTLSSIAKKYNISVDELKRMNNLHSDNIQLGAKLVVGETTTNMAQSNTSQTEAKVDETPDIAVVDSKKDIKKEEKVTEQTTENVVVPTDKMVADKNNDKPVAITTNTYKIEDGDEVSENGIAIISNEGELNLERSFVLHPTAKIGTIIMITNPENSNAVFARVVGSCKVSNGNILKMSKTVADKLGLKEDGTVKINYAR